jgi:endonuclease/exonuclease/phosphatase family metal-dependent hydrolase
MVMLLGCVFAPCVHAAQFPLTVVSFNVLVEISRKPDVPSWRDRKEACAELLRRTQADLIGLQEPLPTQVEFFLKSVPGFKAVVAEGYTDAALLYRTSEFDLLEQGHWWLSPTPEKRSSGFGNFLPRILVWGKFKHKPSGQELYVFNTHFDNSMPSQSRMAELCQKKLKPFMESGLPLIWVGDFNTDQKRGRYDVLTSNGWKDSYVKCSKASPDGRDDNVRTMADGNTRIDHIFYFGKGIEPAAWERLEPLDGKTFYSDHFAVMAKLQLNVP